ncbi:pilus assembly protein [Cellulosimicrobium arenosum]|uniref:Pilus assembly protein n=1 Tax=Cellulosimicrobium arenosum TaxID=2708133 RepID=A0A927G6X1_9MICO|nr:pilus assembly protein [Cellulosimicrobium arenosum]
MVGGATGQAGGADARGERGSAIVEFLGVALVLLLPTMYLVLTVGRLQAATFAVEGASREAARAFVTAQSAADGSARAAVAVRIALDDQGFDGVGTADALTLACSSTECLEPGSAVTSSVRVEVPLPLVPDFARSAVPLAIPVQAQHVASVDEYAARRP